MSQCNKGQKNSAKLITRWSCLLLTVTKTIEKLANILQLMRNKSLQRAHVVLKAEQESIQ